jgi:Cation transporting ATPase, C-terminus
MRRPPNPPDESASPEAWAVTSSGWDAHGAGVAGRRSLVPADCARDLADHGLHYPHPLPDEPRHGYPHRRPVALQSRPALQHAAPRAVTLTFVLQILAIYAPLFQSFLDTKALPIADLAIAIALSTIIFWAVEMEKWLARRKSSHQVHHTEGFMR